MTTPELPPLRRYDYVQWCMDRNDKSGELSLSEDVEARERILLARIAELEAVLVKFDERWFMDGELGFCVVCCVSIEAGDAHRPECWLAEARAVIDAARGQG